MNSEPVSRAKSTATDFIGKQFDQRRGTVEQQIETSVQSLRTIAEHLRADEKTQPAAKIADQLAGYAEHAGSYLQGRDLNELVVDLEIFSRSRPWAVATGALIAGFAVSRVIKAGSVARYRPALSTSSN